MSLRCVRCVKGYIPVSVDVLRCSVVSIGPIQRPGSYAEVHRRVRVLQGKCRGEFKCHIRELRCGDD